MVGDLNPRVVDCSEESLAVKHHALNRPYPFIIYGADLMIADPTIDGEKMRSYSSAPCSSQVYQAKRGRRSTICNLPVLPPPATSTSILTPIGNKMYNVAMSQKLKWGLSSMVDLFAPKEGTD